MLMASLLSLAIIRMLMNRQLTVVRMRPHASACSFDASTCSFDANEDQPNEDDENDNVTPAALQLMKCRIFTWMTPTVLVMPLLAHQMLEHKNICLLLHDEMVCDHVEVLRLHHPVGDGK